MKEDYALFAISTELPRKKLQRNTTSMMTG